VPTVVTGVELRHLGGALAREPAVPAALPGRDGEFAVFVVGVLAPPVADAVPAAAVAVLDALRPWALPTRFVAFAGTGDPVEVYGSERLARLLRVKEALDPTGVFQSGGALR
jgi:hypothetical protein